MPPLTEKQKRVLHRGVVLKEAVYKLPYKPVVKEWAWFGSFMLLFHGSATAAIIECCVDIACVMFGKRLLAYGIAGFMGAKGLEIDPELIAEVVNEEVPEIERMLS